MTKKYHLICQNESKTIIFHNKIQKLLELKNHYKNLKPKKIMTMDGVSVEFDDYWFNVRPSNTEPLLRLNLGNTPN